MFLRVMLADKCNLSCKMCRFFKYATGAIMPVERYINILEQCAGLTIAGAKVKGIVLQATREGLLYPYLFEALSETKKRGFEAHLETNGLLLTEDTAKMLVEGGLDNLVISVTGTSTEVYKNFQGFGRKNASEQLETVVNNVKNLVYFRNKQGSRLQIVITYIVTEESVQDVDKAVFFWKNIGVDYMMFYTDLNLIEDKISGGGHRLY